MILHKNENKTILIKNANYIITLNNKHEILRNKSLLIEGVFIKEVDSKAKKADQIIEASGMVIFPGFINTHLHIPQVFHRHCPAQQNKPIAQWIKITTSINSMIDEESMYYGALVCFTELILSGTTTTLDYFYPFVKGNKGTMEATIKAARDIGIRFTSIRGSMSQSVKNGTLYDESVTENLDDIIAHSTSMIEKHHNNLMYSMTRIGVGPCLPFSSVGNDYYETAKLARKYPGVILQTHAAESNWEVEYCKKKFGLSPVSMMEKNDFLGKDVSLVHCNIISKKEIELLGKTRTNIVITPVCNTRDASDGNGIAPISQLIKAGANISLGVDGAASNDSLNLQEEMRYFRTVCQAKEGLFWHNKEDQSKFSYWNPQDVLEKTILGGAKTLNRNDIGIIEEGKAADITIFNPDSEISHAGVLNKWGAIMSCQNIKPKYLIINGRVIVKDGNIMTIDVKSLNKKFRKLHMNVINKAEKGLGLNLFEYI